MAATIKHLTSAELKDKRSFEILIVDDGSRDGTSATALKLANTYSTCDIKVVTLEKNVGKGGAVRHGMLYGGGERLLMADADGASRIEDLEALWKKMDEIAPDNALGVVVGSRAHLVKSEAVVKVCLLLRNFQNKTTDSFFFFPPALIFAKRTDVRTTHRPSHCRCWSY